MTYEEVPPVGELDHELARLLEMRAERVALTDAIKEQENRVGELMGQYQVGNVTRHKRMSRKSWDKEWLRRDVLDAQMFDPETGEALTPVDKVCHETLGVWNLGTPRLTRLKAIGLEADDYCTVEEQPGWTIDVALP